MNKVETEILVLGSGLAGIASALSARRSGRKVVVLSRDGGASAMSSGALDLAGDPIAVSGKPELWSNELRRNLLELLRRNPDHPYHLLGASPEEVSAKIKGALEMVFPAEDDFLRGDFVQNQLVFNQLGTFKATAFFQKQMLSLQELAGLNQVSLLAVEGLKDFEPEFFKKNFEYLCAKLGVNLKTSIIKVNLKLDASKSSPELADYIEKNPELVLEALSASVKGVPTELVVLPPILPGAKREEILQTLEKESRIKPFELLSLPPSVPGKRLEQYLDRRLSQAGIERIYGKAIGFEAEGKRLLLIRAQTLREELEVRAQGFILATGGFLGGGISKRGEFKEEIFGIPIFLDQKPLGRIFTEKLTRLRITEPHPIFSLGIKTDSAQRPIGSDGEVFFENLFGAGSILSGANYIFEGTGAGVALATGLNAGERLAKL